MELRGMTEEELQNLMVHLGFPSYRGKQVFHWVQRQAITDLEEMGNVPRSLKDSLKEKTTLPPLIVQDQQSSAEGAEKSLWKLPNGDFVESVLLFHKDRVTLCISSQVGCKFKCVLCATGYMGKKRDLSSGEIMAQVLESERYVQKKGKGPIKNVVFMGMGEPLDNYSNVLRAVHLLCHPRGRNKGARHITISTCGLIPQMYELARLRLQVVLAVSLHAAHDELRHRLMPINKKYPLQPLIEACKAYSAASGRRVSFEYALLKDVNDSLDDARALIQLLRGFPAHVNLIPANPIAQLPYEPSPPRQVERFYKCLQQSSLEVSLRKTKGQDIQAACGQLYTVRKGE